MRAYYRKTRLEGQRSHLKGMAYAGSLGFGLEIGGCFGGITVIGCWIDKSDTASSTTFGCSCSDLFSIYFSDRNLSQLTFY